MRAAQVRPDGSTIRWVEIPGTEPARVYLHGLGASAAPHYAAAVADPRLGGRRSLLLDFLGFGLSDRPANAGYTVAEHAEWTASALMAAGVEGAQVVAHSMGGSVAIVLAARFPRLVRSLVLVDPNLDPMPAGVSSGSAGVSSGSGPGLGSGPGSGSPGLGSGSGSGAALGPGPGSSRISEYDEDDFLKFGRDRILRRAGAQWASTMRLAGPEALYRSARSLAQFEGRELLLRLKLPRTVLYPVSLGLDGADGLRAGGVSVVPVVDCGHNIMLDNLNAFVAAVAGAP